MAPLFSSIFILLYVYALLIDPHVIHSHEDWERGGLIRITRPVSTNCDVQDKEEWIIKRIRLPIHHARVDGEIFTVIHQKMNLILGPIHGEHMEFAIKMIGVNTRGGALMIPAWPIRSPMRRSVHCSWQVT